MWVFRRKWYQKNPKKVSENAQFSGKKGQKQHLEKKEEDRGVSKRSRSTNEYSPKQISFVWNYGSYPEYFGYHTQGSLRQINFWKCIFLLYCSDGRGFVGTLPFPSIYNAHLKPTDKWKTGKLLRINWRFRRRLGMMVYTLIILSIFDCIDYL